MRSGHKTFAAFFTVLSGLLLALVGLVVRWPPWAWVTVVGLLLVTAVLTARSGRRDDPIPQEKTLEPDLPIPPLERWEQVVTDVALPSAMDDYDFLFSATVRWCPGDAPAKAPLVNAAGLAANAVLDRARRVAASQPPYRTSLVQHELSAALGSMRPDASGRVRAMAENVSLSLSDMDRQRLSKLATTRKNKELWEHERNYERNKRDYLGKDVLKDTGSAVVWWLSKDDEKVEDTVQLIGTLAQLSAAAKNQDVPEEFQHMAPFPVPDEPEPGGQNGQADGPYFADPFRNGSAPSAANGHKESAADMLEKLLGAMSLTPDDPVGVHFADRVTEAVRVAGRTDLAEEMERRFNPPPPPEGQGTEDPENG